VVAVVEHRGRIAESSKALARGSAAVASSTRSGRR